MPRPRPFSPLFFKAAAWPLLLLVLLWAGTAGATSHVHAPHDGKIHLDSQSGDWDGHCDFCRHTLKTGASAPPAAGLLPPPPPQHRPAAQPRLCASHPAPACASLAARPPPAA